MLSGPAARYCQLHPVQADGHPELEKTSLSACSNCFAKRPVRGLFRHVEGDVLTPCFRDQLNINFFKQKSSATLELIAEWTFS
jgi:hypothetical protein